MENNKGDSIAKIMEWAWNCGLLIRTDHQRQFVAETYRNETAFRKDPSPYNLDTQFRKREECWPVLRFSHPMTGRHQELVARDWEEMWRMLEHRHKQIFAELGCPEWPKRKAK